MNSEEKQAGLIPAQSAALSKAGPKSLAARSRRHLRDREEAEEWLRKGLGLRDMAPDDPHVRAPVNPYVTPDLCAQLQTAVKYINQVSAGSAPDAAAKSLGMTCDDLEVAQVAYFFVPEALAEVMGKSVGWPERRNENHASSTIPLIPSPAGMDDDVLTQKTVELLVQIPLELDRIRQQVRERDRTLTEAFHCLELGYELDPMNPELLYWLAGSYCWGCGVQRNKEMAADLYRRAADQGHSDSQYCLGILYSDGEGVAQDEVEAAAWFRKAAEQGNMSAMVSLGVAYKDGCGVPQDYAQGVMWLRKAGEKEDFGDPASH